MSDGAARPCTGQQTGPTRYELGSSVSERRQRFVLPPKCAEVNVLKTPETCIASMIGLRAMLEKKKTSQAWPQSVSHFQSIQLVAMKSRVLTCGC